MAGSRVACVLGCEEGAGAACGSNGPSSVSRKVGIPALSVLSIGLNLLKQLHFHVDTSSPDP